MDGEGNNGGNEGGGDVGVQDAGGPPPGPIENDAGGGGEADAAAATSAFRASRGGTVEAPRQNQPRQQGQQPQRPAAPEQKVDDDPLAKAYEPQDAADDAGDQEGDAQGADNDEKADDGLAAFAQIFALDPAKVTGAAKDAMVSDVRATLEAARTQAGAAQASPPAPGTPPQASPQTAQQPAANGTPPAASGPIAPLTKEQIEQFAEYGPAAKHLAESHNALLAQSQDSATMKSELATLRQQISNEITWNGIQPWASEFCAKLAAKGLPAVPASELRSLVMDADAYIGAKNRQFHAAGQTQRLSPEQGMRAVYMERYGEKVEKQAADAKNEGKREMRSGLQRRARQFDVGGGTGSIPRTPRVVSDDQAQMQIVSSWRRQQNQQR